MIFRMWRGRRSLRPHIIIIKAIKIHWRVVLLSTFPQVCEPLGGGEAPHPVWSTGEPKACHLVIYRYSRGHPFSQTNILYWVWPPPGSQYNIFYILGATPCFSDQYNILRVATPWFSVQYILYSRGHPLILSTIYYIIHQPPPDSQVNIIYYLKWLGPGYQAWYFIVAHVTYVLVLRTNIFW